MANSNEGTLPALSDEQARQLLEAPVEDTLKGVRDRAFSPSPMKPISPRCRMTWSCECFDDPLYDRRKMKVIWSRYGSAMPDLLFCQ